MVRAARHSRSRHVATANSRSCAGGSTQGPSRSIANPQFKFLVPSCSERHESLGSRPVAKATRAIDKFIINCADSCGESRLCRFKYNGSFADAQKHG